MYNELYHHGILGQRWGVRRFQNADGSLTSAGMKRYRTNSGGGYTSAIEGAAKSMSRKNVSDKVTKEASSITNGLKNLSPQQKVALTTAGSKGVKKIAQEGKKASKEAAKQQVRKEASDKASKMSDEELKKRVSRMNLEKQFEDLSSRNVSAGKNYVYETLDLAGDILTVGVSAATLYMMIKGKGLA